jgi:predicted MPP superfamily phosphohydrolase
MRSLRRRFLATLSGLLVAVFLYGLIEARSDPIVRRAHITMIGADPHTPPLRVALVSDIHVSNLAMPVWRLNRVVDQINAQHPDVILLAGDFVNGVGDQSWDFHPWDLVAPLSRLHAPLGVHAVLGNHDILSAKHFVDIALHRAGIDVMNDRAERIGPIALIGMDMNDTYRARIAPVLAQARRMGGFPVLMTHGPPLPHRVPDDIPLIVVGHTHCGQIVGLGWDNAYDLLNRMWRFPPSLRCGIGHIGRQVVVITGGVGAATIPPIRLNAPPDFWILTLTGKSL